MPFSSVKMTPQLEANLRKAYPTGRLREPLFDASSYDIARAVGVRLREVMPKIGYEVDLGDVHPRWRKAFVSVTLVGDAREAAIERAKGALPDDTVLVAISRISPYVSLRGALLGTWVDHVPDEWRLFQEAMVDVCRGAGAIDIEDELFDLPVPFIEWADAEFWGKDRHTDSRPASVGECLFDDDADPRFYKEATPLLKE